MTDRIPDKPEPRPRRQLGQGDVDSLKVRLRTVTPILGGAATPRTVDEVDIIRAPSIRGQLRFWWRALYGNMSGDAKELAKRESELWGAAGAGGASRSPVEVRVLEARAVPRRSVDPRDRRPLRNDAEARRRHQNRLYAIWPALVDRAKFREEEDIEFVLEVRAPQARTAEVQKVLTAWILFGGYGARVRRGCGSLTVVSEEAHRWLPADVSRRSLGALFGDLPLLQASTAKATDVPSLCGARLLHGSPGDAEGSWLNALEWLREFRQGTPARERSEEKRPGRSRWPEADKIRKLTDRWPEVHAPRAAHAAGPAWPRAGFGLPIVGQFQSKDRSGNPYRPREPENFELHWEDRDGIHHSRLASPLILKPMPLANGRFVPIALWLFRRYPLRGKVFLLEKPRDGGARRISGSEAPFDRLLGAGDTPIFAPLDGHTTLQDAFLDWLKQARQLQELSR